MAPSNKTLDEYKIEDVDFETVKSLTDKRIVKRFLRLLEEDGNYYTELVKACKEKLLELAPKEYYLLYPRQASEHEINDAFEDLLDWEASVKETDQALKSSIKDKIWEDIGPKTRMQIRGLEPVHSRPNVHRAEPDCAASRQDRVDERSKLARDQSKIKDYYSAWDKVDIDAIEAEMEKEAEEEERARKAHFGELKQKQQEAELTTPVAPASVSSNIPEAHRRHMADCEKEKGNEAFYAKDFEEAEAYYSRSLQYLADDPSTWANRALARLKLKQPEGALEDCEHSLALNSRYMKALHRKGKALHELGRYQEAVRWFQRAMAESPGNTQINGDLQMARRKLRTDGPGCAAPTPPRATPAAIEQGKSADNTTYRRVQIEEDSGSEDDSECAPARAGGSSSSTAPATSGMRKIQIQEVTDSEDEKENEVSQSKRTDSPSRAAAASHEGTVYRNAHIVEEDREEDAETATSGAGGSLSSTAPAPAPEGIRKIQIQEASDTEDEKEVSHAQTFGSPSTAATTSNGGTVFRKVLIEEASDSEDDAECAPFGAGGSSSGPAPASSGMRKIQIQEATESEDEEEDTLPRDSHSFAPPSRGATAAKESLSAGSVAANAPRNAPNDLTQAPLRDEASPVAMSFDDMD